MIIDLNDLNVNDDVDVNDNVDVDILKIETRFVAKNNDTNIDVNVNFFFLNVQIFLQLNNFCIQCLKYFNEKINCNAKINFHMKSIISKNRR